MFRIAIQVKELISSNVTSTLDAVSDPAKMLAKLQREIEEAIISLEGERAKTAQHKKRLEASLKQNEVREADWGDKAKSAMDHGREDLARQALLAREDCREAIAGVKDDIAQAKNDIAEISSAIKDLEVKHKDTRDETIAQSVADRAGASTLQKASTAQRHMNRISEMEKRAEFAAEEQAAARTNANVESEIDEMRRASAVDAEMEALKSGAKKASARKKK